MNVFQNQLAVRKLSTTTRYHILYTITKIYSCEGVYKNATGQLFCKGRLCVKLMLLLLHNSFQFNAIFFFQGFGRREIVEVLLHNGGDVHARDDG